MTARTKHLPPNRLVGVVGVVAMGVLMSVMTTLPSKGGMAFSPRQHVAPAAIERELVEPSTPDAPDDSLRQRRVAKFIAEEWDLGLDYTKTVVSAAFKAAERYQLDPLTLLAIAGKESAFRHIGNNPWNTYGIMQVIGRLHQDKFRDGVVKPVSVAENIDIGAQVVQECLDRVGGSESRALQCYNGSPRKARYAVSVAQLKQKLLRVFNHPEEFADES